MTYDIFRQGLEIQDLDPITYQIIAKNKNSIGNWFPELTQAVKKQDFFKIPDTTIIRVPLPLLQLTKLDYMELTKTSLEIADRFCEKLFRLTGRKNTLLKQVCFHQNLTSVMLISREQKKCVQLESIYYLSIFRHPAWLTLI